MNKKWWHDKVAYQIYPKSFCDSNGDGIGDLRGIISKLDYLANLGIDILWLSPIYLSPFADQGYDIADYYQIDPRFGTMEDMEELIQKADAHGIKILMDLVVNHCSDEHEWFRQACADPEGPYGNYFYLRPKSDTLPTNWRSYFGGSCWEPIPGTDYQYLHVFHKKQPDLNWENQAVREEVYRNINFWLDKGLGGFRIDAIINIKKAFPFHDYPVDRPDGLSSIQNMLAEATGIGAFLGELRDRTFAKYDAFTVGEVFDAKEDELADFIGENGYFSAMFDFSTHIFGASEKGWYDRTPITPEDYKHCCFTAQKKTEKIGFLANIIENHDEPRGASYYLPIEGQTDTGKKMLAAITLLLRGIPFIYQGQEIGMENTTFHSIADVDDVSTIHEYHTALRAGLSKEDALKAVAIYSRDNARTPMQWSAAKNAGFTTGSPWLAANPNYTSINVESEEHDPDSVLSFYKAVIALRKNPAYKDTFVYGSLIPWKETQTNLMAYLRCYQEQQILILANFQNAPQSVPAAPVKLLLNNRKEFVYDNGTLTLQGFQAIVLELSQPVDISHTF